MIWGRPLQWAKDSGMVGIIICLRARVIITFISVYRLRGSLYLSVVVVRADLFLLALGHFTLGRKKDFYKRNLCIVAGFIWGSIWQIPIRLMCISVLLLFSLAFLKFWEEWIIILTLNFRAGLALAWVCFQFSIGARCEDFTLYEILVRLWRRFTTLKADVADWILQGGGRPPSGNCLPFVPGKDLDDQGAALKLQRLAYFPSMGRVRLSEGDYWLKVVEHGTGKRFLLTNTLSSVPSGWKVFLPASKDLDLGVYGVHARKRLGGGLKLCCIYLAPLGYKE